MKEELSVNEILSNSRKLVFKLSKCGMGNKAGVMGRKNYEEAEMNMKVECLGRGVLINGRLRKVEFCHLKHI